MAPVLKVRLPLVALLRKVTLVLTGRLKLAIWPGPGTPALQLRGSLKFPPTLLVQSEAGAGVGGKMAGRVARHSAQLIRRDRARVVRTRDRRMKDSGRHLGAGC